MEKQAQGATNPVAPVRPVSRQIAAMVVKGAGLSAAVVATLLAIVILIPEGNDYARAAELKHDRLAALPHKLVLVGGSNLAYGTDSDKLQAATGCDVVNMGMNGFLGVRYMLEEVRPYLRPSDVVVVALEYDSFYKSVDGTASDHFAVIKAYPPALAYLNWRQRLAVAGTIPFVAQQKVLRLMEEAATGLRTLLLGERPKPKLDIDKIESFSAFTPKGDITSHLGVRWDGPVEQGINLDKTPLDGDVLNLLQDFQKDMDKRGVKVMFSYTPVVRNYYVRYQKHIDDLYELMARQHGMPVPDRPGNFVFDESMMFDTVYHLNAEGRAIRTEKLAHDINQEFGGRPTCSAPIQVTKNGTGS